MQAEICFREIQIAAKIPIKENWPSEMPLDLKLLRKLAPESYFCQRGLKMDFEKPSM